MNAEPILLSERRRPSLAMYDALAAWHAETKPAEDLTLKEIDAFIAGYRGERDPMVEAYLAGQLASLMADLLPAAPIRREDVRPVAGGAG